jgi:hypothetical protein
MPNSKGNLKGVLPKGKVVRLEQSFFALCDLGCFFGLGLEMSAGCVNYRPLKSTNVNESQRKSTNVNKSQQAATTDN